VRRVASVRATASSSVEGAIWKKEGRALTRAVRNVGR
jgi:hypothetical protein